jgi:hypothetical protein
MPKYNVVVSRRERIEIVIDATNEEQARGIAISTNLDTTDHEVIGSLNDGLWLDAIYKQEPADDEVVEYVKRLVEADEEANKPPTI